MSYVMRSSCVSLALVGACFVGSSAAAKPTIHNLGTLGGTVSQGHSLNSDGHVAGTSRISGDGELHPFLYLGTPGSGTMHDLGTLGGTEAFVGGINASNQVVGASRLPADAPGHAFLYTGTPGVDGQMIDLGTLPGGTFSGADDINDAGQIAGASHSTDGIRAFRYVGTPGIDGVMQDLGTLGGPTSNGYAINASGQVSGQSDTSTPSVRHAFRYTGTPGIDGVMEDLGTLGGFSAYGFAINDIGQVAGYSNTVSPSESHAFLYSGTPGIDGVMHDLGTLGGNDCEGYGLNNFGNVVGFSLTTGNAAEHAFFYTGTPGVDGQMIDLDVWLDANNPAEGAKWTLRQAHDVTDSGLVTGYGTYDDGPDGLTDGLRAFVLDASALVPEPAALSLLPLTAALVLRRVRSGVFS